MSDINILVAVVFDDALEGGVNVLHRLLARSTGLKLQVYRGWKRTAISGPKAGERLALGFNLVEGVATGLRSSLLITEQSELRFRFRPPVASQAWTKLDLPDRSPMGFTGPKAVWDIFMSLVPLGHPSRLPESKRFGVFELLCTSLSYSSTEDAIANLLNECCPDLPDIGAWGIANTVPFRPLTVDEEWRAARSFVFWADPGRLRETWYQYVFTTTSASPAVEVPLRGVHYGSLTIHKAETPGWAR
jgi:hypothetical protein